MISNSISCPLPTIRAHRIPFENLTTLPNFAQLSQRYRNIVQSPNPIREFHHTPELHSAFATISKYRAITEPHSRILPHSRTSLSFRNNIEISRNHRTTFENFTTLPNFTQLSQRYRNIVQPPFSIRDLPFYDSLPSDSLASASAALASRASGSAVSISSSSSSSHGKMRSPNSSTTQL